MTEQMDPPGFAEFPELRRLVVLREAGWIFFPRGDGARLVQLHGVRTWPDGSSDGLMVRFTTDAGALRTDPAGGLVWQRDGGLAEVVDALLTLPPPGSPTAPRLVRGSGPGAERSVRQLHR
jgi:hypothetical protein